MTKRDCQHCGRILEPHQRAFCSEMCRAVYFEVLGPYKGLGAPRSIRGEEEQGEAWVHGSGGSTHEVEVDERAHWYATGHGSGEESELDGFDVREGRTAEDEDVLELPAVSSNEPDDDDDDDEDDEDEDLDDDPSEKIAEASDDDGTAGGSAISTSPTSCVGPTLAPQSPINLAGLMELNLELSRLLKESDPEEAEEQRQINHKEQSGPFRWAFSTRLENHVGIRVDNVDVRHVVAGDVPYFLQLFVQLSPCAAKPKVLGDLRVTARALNNGVYAVGYHPIPRYTDFPPERTVLVELALYIAPDLIEVYPELA